MVGVAFICESNANHLKSILLNMDFKWLALLSFVVHLWPKLNVINVLIFIKCHKCINIYLTL